MIHLEPYLGQSTEDRNPVSAVEFGQSPASCAEIQDSTDSSGGSTITTASDSTCTEPELLDDGRYHRSCLSPAVTL